MCWNLQVSLTFALLYFLTIILYIVKRPKYWRGYSLFSGFYLVMELFQAAQWLYGDVETTYSEYGPKSCSLINKNFTYVAYVLIWLQPFLYSIIGLIELKKKVFKKLMLFNLIIFLYGIIDLIILRKIYNIKYMIKDSNFGPDTCTDVGPTHHLTWRFSPSNIDLQLNNLTYLILCGVNFLFYKNELKNIRNGWLFALILTKIILFPTNAEMPSSWCLMSVFANLLILMGADFQT